MTQKRNSVTETLNYLINFKDKGASQLIVYTPKITPRFKYVCEFIFGTCLGVNFNLTDNEKEFRDSSLAKINYSILSFENAFNIQPAGFLNETEIKNFVPKSHKQNDLIYFFKISGADLDHDIFSAVFYFISRYEEWLPCQKDKHGRFELANSILFKNGFHKIPVVDHWVLGLKNALAKKFPKLNFAEREFKVISTIDVDNVFAYKAKPWYRVGGALVKDLLKLDLKNVNARMQTVFFNKHDPFDVYDEVISYAKQHDLPLIYFFLYRNNTEFDRTIDPNHPEFIKLLKNIKEQGIEIGIHPSYFSSQQPELLESEIALLNKNSDEKTIFSRQHYLRMDIQNTPKHLIERGIKYDFTMGFASGIGFRAGTTFPFHYFDLKNNCPLQLIGVPFAFMDGAFFVYNDYKVTEAEKEIFEMINEVKRVKGLFVSVFHERTFSERLLPGWRAIYFKIHSLVSGNKNLMGGN